MKVRCRNASIICSFVIGTEVWPLGLMKELQYLEATVSVIKGITNISTNVGLVMRIGKL